LGLGAPAATARTKLLNAISPPLAEEAGSLSTWFLHDPDPATGNRIPHGELRRLARSIHRHRMVELTIGEEPTVAVRPLALVLKAGSWHLVVLGRNTTEVVCIDDLRATSLTDRAFIPPDGFDLITFWTQQVRAGCG
jgi:hypothetical protein